MVRKAGQALSAVGLLVVAQHALAVELVQTFDDGKLERDIWKTCQAQDRLLKPASVTYDGMTRRVLQSLVDEKTDNIESCPAEPAGGPAEVASAEAERAAFFRSEIDDGSDLGPSLVESDPATAAQAPADCAVGKEGDEQRNELRIKETRGDLIHNFQDPHFYSMTFRLGGKIFPCGSARWVIGQWKEAAGISPVLAQRFDNGVLHVTVQNDHCRCVVAQAEGNFDAMTASLGLARDTGRASLKRRAPIKCIVSNNPPDEPEESCRPKGLFVETRGGLPPPALTDPQKAWTTMTYRIALGQRGDSRIDIYDGVNFVVRVVGQIGYGEGDPGDVKFKFGHYRNRIPGTAKLEVDRICVSKAAETCAPGIAIVP